MLIKNNEIIEGSQNQFLQFRSLNYKKIKKLYSKSLLFIDKTTPYYNQFQVLGNKIKRIGNNCNCYQILMEEVIPKDKVYRFKIKITKY
jgi:hypothetical protein